MLRADATFAFGDNYVEEGRARGEHGSVWRALVVWASCACAATVLAVRADRAVGVERAKAETAYAMVRNGEFARTLVRGKRRNKLSVAASSGRVRGGLGRECDDGAGK